MLEADRRQRGAAADRQAREGRRQPQAHPALQQGSDGPSTDFAVRQAVTAALRLAAAAAAGLGLDAAFPGLGWWPLAPVSLAVLFILLRGRGVALASLLGLVFGLAFFVPHLSWSGIYVGPVPWLALSVLQALYVAAFGATVAVLGRRVRTPSRQLLLCPPLWIAQEAARGSTPFGGFPWGRVAFSQADSPALGWAWLGGAPLVTFVVAAAAALCAIAMLQLRPHRWGGSGHVRTGLALLVGAVTLVGAGAPLLTLGQDARADGLSVAAVQGNVAEPGLEFNAERRAVLANHVDGTLRLAQEIREGRRAKPDIVLWPENSSDIDPTRDAVAEREITKAAASVGVPVVVGAVLAEPAPKVSNSTLVWGPTGRVLDRYDKHRPVPFAEYVPYRSFFRAITRTVDLVRTDFAAGNGPHIVDAGPVRLGVAICFEVAFDDHLRTAAKQGAQLLFVPTNNATFGRTDESEQQLAMSRLRAVELGRSVAHVSTVGVSALIRPDGRLAATGGHFTTEVLSASLPLSTTIRSAAHSRSRSSRPASCYPFSPGAGAYDLATARPDNL